MRPRVAVLIISGFLGSGKTTLVRALLTRAQEEGLKVGIISNEFGELGIDAALLGAGEQEFVELSGGCVCCRLADDLVDTLERMRERIDPDRIIIETSGAALPFETQLNLYRPPVRDWVGDEACVVVVDAERLHLDEDIGETFADQVSGADLLVLSKVDRVPTAALPALRARLQEMNPGVPVLLSAFGDVDPAALFPPSPGRKPPGPRPHTHEAFDSEVLTPPEGLSPEALLGWLEAHRGLRMKGFVRTTAGVQIVQGVGRRIELQMLNGLVIPSELIGRVVVIRQGDGLTHHEGLHG